MSAFVVAFLFSATFLQFATSQQGLAGYRIRRGNCPGNNFQRCCFDTSGRVDCTQQCSNADQCASICSSDSRCQAFLFVTVNPGRPDCLFKSTTCADNQLLPTTDAVLYEKSQSPTPTPTATVPPSNVECTLTNEGSEFWVMFMTNKADSPDPNVNMELFVTPSKNVVRSIQVTMESPTIATVTQTVSPGAVTKFEVPRELKMLEQSNIEKKGIRIRSVGGDIVLYGVNKDRYTADGFLGLPRSGVGREYYTVSFHPPTWQCEFGIAAIEDNTIVTITLPRDVASAAQRCSVLFQNRNYTNGQQWRMQMNSYDSFQAISSNKCDLTGTRVQSDKPISVFSGNLRTFVGDSRQATQSGITRDHLVEQLYSVDRWGYEFVTVPIPDRQPNIGDYWIFVASEDNTVITLVSTNGRRDTINLAQGQGAKRLLAQGDFWHITTNRDGQGRNKPIQAMQIVHSQVVSLAECQQTAGRGPSKNCHDPSMINYTPVQQFGFGYTFVTPSAVATNYINRMMITIQSGQQQGLRLNNQPLSSSTAWTRIGDSSYVGATIEIDGQRVGAQQQRTHTISHTNSRVSFATYIYGAGDRESYAFPTGVCLKALVCTPTTQRPEDRIDNDCDNRIDEETCYNGIDDDGDGRIDEDCGRVTPVCQPTTQRPEDRIDNDCDGRIDEETCYNGIDDDGDGRIDEDCGRITPVCQPTTQRPEDRIDNDCDGRTDEETCYDGIDDDRDGRIDEDCGRVIPVCTPTTQRPEDRIDNDCDGRTDEETCYNGIDDDGDGRIDEDCGRVTPVTTQGPTIRQCRDVTTRTICSGKQESISCPVGQRIRLIHAHYGRIGYSGERSCGIENPVEIDCGFSNVYASVAPICEAKQQCSLMASSFGAGEPMNKGPCQECAKYLQVSYVCVSQSEACRVLSGLQLSTNPEDYYRASSFSVTSNQGKQCRADGCGWCPASEECCDSENVDSKACYPDKAQFSSDATEAWCPTPCDTSRPYLTIDLGGHYQVTGYVVQGARKLNHWVTSLAFQYSLDGKTWTNVGSQTGEPAQYVANTDARTIRWCTFNQRYTARWVRAYVWGFKEFPAMHLDILRCDQLIGCNTVSIAGSNYAGGISGLVGQKVVVNCRDRSLTNFTMTCNQSRQWSGQRSCGAATTCGDVPLVPGALHNARSTNVGSRVTYTCVRGTMSSGQSTITCGQNGQWSQSPACQGRIPNA